MTRPNFRRRVVFDKVVNFRDLGGFLTTDGKKVASGHLFRSGILSFASDLDLVRLRNLGIRSVVDLRTSAEIEMQGQADTGRIRGSMFHIPVLEKLWDSSMFDMAVDPVLFLSARYSEILEHHGQNLVKAVSAIIESRGPVVFHCSAGKDRTGLVAALLLEALGVAETDIVADYEATVPEMDSLLALMRSVNPMFEEQMRSQPVAFLAAPAEAMSRTLTNLRWTDGGAVQYLLRSGLPKSLLRDLCTRMLSR